MIRRQTTQQPQHTLLGVVERLLAGVTVVGGAIYVLIYALYIEFYDDFGVRPEEVGWDRLAVLGRAAWVAIVGIALVVPISWAITAIIAFINKYFSQPDVERPWLRRLPYVVGIVLTVLLLVGYVWLRNQVEDEANRVSRGESVNGIGFIVPFIDVRAHRAKATWVGDKQEAPAALTAPHLMYLGRGRDIAALVSCGQKTILVPADQVTIELLYQDEDLSRLKQRQQFTELCRPSS